MGLFNIVHELKPSEVMGVDVLFLNGVPVCFTVDNTKVVKDLPPHLTLYWKEVLKHYEYKGSRDEFVVEDSVLLMGQDSFYRQLNGEVSLP